MIKRKFNAEVSFDKVRLHSSEKVSSWGSLFERFKQSIREEDIRYYPNVKSSRAYSLLQGYYKHEELLIGFGSDRCLKYFFEINQDYSKVITTNPNFPMYNIYSDMFNMEQEVVEYDNLIFPIEALLDKITLDSIVVISNPSSPIGDLINTVDILRILDKGVPVLIDEAYIEFSSAVSSIPLIKTNTNLFVTRTFSKALGSAGIRFGTILSQRENIQKLSQYRDMYETSGITLKWVEVLLSNDYYIESYIKKIKETKLLLEDNLRENNIEFITSESNWIHIRGQFNIPNTLEIKSNCTVPGRGSDWIRLCIAEDINKYDWI